MKPTTLHSRTIKQGSAPLVQTLVSAAAVWVAAVGLAACGTQIPATESELGANARTGCPGLDPLGGLAIQSNLGKTFMLRELKGNTADQPDCVQAIFAAIDDTRMLSQLSPVIVLCAQAGERSTTDLYYYSPELLLRPWEMSNESGRFVEVTLLNVGNVLLHARATPTAEQDATSPHLLRIREAADDKRLAWSVPESKLEISTRADLEEGNWDEGRPPRSAFFPVDVELASLDEDSSGDSVRTFGAFLEVSPDEAFEPLVRIPMSAQADHVMDRPVEPPPAGENLD